jgi:multicomponent Na+:H+ antiporter subunit C
MNTVTVFGVAAVVIFCMGLYGVLVIRDMLRKLIALNVMGSSVFLVFVVMAGRSGQSDPVPHAMVLTGIVVTVATTGLAVALLRRRIAEGQTPNLPEDDRGGQR